MGYQGRMGIYELLFMDEDIRSLILNRAASSAIAPKAMENGMRTLRNDGWKKVKAAKTTIEEVLRVTQTEEHLKSLIEDSKPARLGERFLMARWQSANPPAHQRRRPAPLAACRQRRPLCCPVGKGAADE